MILILTFIIDAAEPDNDDDDAKTLSASAKDAYQRVNNHVNSHPVAYLMPAILLLAMILVVAKRAKVTRWTQSIRKSYQGKEYSLVGSR